MLRRADEDLMAFTGLSIGRADVHLVDGSTGNRLNEKIKRRTDVVGIFAMPKPCSASAGGPREEPRMREVSDRRYVAEGSTARV